MGTNYMKNYLLICHGSHSIQISNLLLRFSNFTFTKHTYSANTLNRYSKDRERVRKKGSNEHLNKSKDFEIEYSTKQFIILSLSIRNN